MSSISQYDAERDHFLDSSSLGISHNTRGQTPLHLAASHSHLSIVKLLAAKFPECINRQDASGMTPLMLASRGYPDTDYVAPPQAISAASKNNGAPIQAAANAAGLLTSRLGPGLMPSSRSPAPYTNNTSTLSQIPASNFATVEHFLHLSPTTSLSPPLSALVQSRDALGNTALHHASASGNLKVIRALILAGSDPLAKNNSGWQPQEYSVSIQAEVYYKGLVSEWKERTAHSQTRRAASRSPDKIRQDEGQTSDDANRIQRTRRRQGTIGAPSPTTQTPTQQQANISGMGKGGLRLVMPDDDDEADQLESEAIRHRNPYPTLTRNSGNNRRRGMTDTSHSSSTTSGSGSTELSSGSSRTGETGTQRSEAEDDNSNSVESDDLGDESEDDGTATARNSMYQLEDEGDHWPMPRITMSPVTTSSPMRGYDDGRGGMGSDGRPRPPRLRRPSRLGASEESSGSISAVTPTAPDLWK